MMRLSDSRMLRRLYFDLAYLFGPRWDRGISPPELLEYIRSHAPGRAIDLGCGSGTNALTLAKHGWQTTGIDYSPRAISTARRKARAAGLEAAFVVGDITRDIQICGPFDLALDIGCFHTVQDRRAYLNNLNRLMSGGGHWLMYAFLCSRAGRVDAGVGSAELDLAASFGFRLTLRADGLERPGRPSGWFLFERLSPQH